ncbi:hypothetical protein [Halovivax cerinus]|uniref:hypothetical protein n=1 Tax=Halovivax cerinus TaxID=1487865 RepID=UPI0021156D61|nr:hypothetical protein [Halovivax cerinus]
MLSLVATLAVVGLVAMPIAAQSTNETDETRTIYDFDESPIELVDVEFDDDTAYVTLRTDERAPVTVSDAGFSGHGSFDVQTHSIAPGTETIEVRLKDNEEVGISTPQDGFRYQGDTALLDVIQGAPTTTLVAWALISGVGGSVIALAISVAILRRSHENNYRELTSREKIRIEENPVEGWVDTLKRAIVRNRFALVALGLLAMYAALSLVGVVPGVVEIWDGLTNGARIVVVGVIVATVVSFLPVFALATRLWDPAKEFVVSADARDILDEALGSKGGLGELIEAAQNGEIEPDETLVGLSIYSGPPERIAEMQIDGAAADSTAPGGPVHIVEDFDPRRNRARGTWPGTANDVEIIAARSAIDGNREILRDESAMLRSLLSALPAIQTAADTGAVRAIDRELRQTLAVDGSPVDGIMRRASRGTRFEGFYDGPDDAEDQLAYEESDDDRDDQDADETDAETEASD